MQDAPGRHPTQILPLSSCFFPCVGNLISRVRRWRRGGSSLCVWSAVDAAPPLPGFAPFFFVLFLRVSLSPKKQTNLIFGLFLPALLLFRPSVFGLLLVRSLLFGRPPPSPIPASGCLPPVSLHISLLPSRSFELQWLLSCSRVQSCRTRR